MKISIIIPVYNEVAHLGACLEAIARQSVEPFEVIVVDNNSTDASAAVAAGYPFVRLLHEPHQGVLHARTTGFNAARGDIIARLDADSRILEDWVETLQNIFKDPSVDAVSGVALYYDVAAANLLNGIDLFFRRRLERQLAGHVYLWGANMALRREAWQQVTAVLCHDGAMHEDYDIAIHLQELGGSVRFDERLRAQVSSRRVDSNYRDFMNYVLVSPRTYARHNLSCHRHMYEVVAVCAVGYLPAKLLHRGYDPTQNRFSWNRVLVSTVPRVDPTINVA